MKTRCFILFLTVLLALSLLPMTAFAASTHASCAGSSCLVCEVADKINALPKADKITAENAAEVMERLHAIDRIKFDLSDDQYEELLTLVDQGDNGFGGGLGVPVRYMEAVEAVRAFGGTSLAIGKKFIDTDGAKVDVTDANGNSVTSSTATLFVTATVPTPELTPIPEDAPIPETGDGMGLFVFVGLAIASVFGMAVMNKREQN